MEWIPVILVLVKAMFDFIRDRMEQIWWNGFTVGVPVGFACGLLAAWLWQRRTGK